MNGNGTNQHDELARNTFRLAVRKLLANEDPNGENPATFGRYAEPYRNLVEVFRKDGGARAVERVVNGTPEYAALVAGDPEHEPEGLAARWSAQLLRVSDIYAPLEPRKYAIDRVFALPSVNTIYGPPGSHKTNLAIEACVCVAHGLPWLPPLPNRPGEPFATHKTRSLFIGFDMDDREHRERFAASCRAHEVDPNSDYLGLLSLPDPVLDITNDHAIHELRAFLVDGGWQFVVIDSLVDIKGAVDENTADMADGLRRLRYLTSDLGASMTLITHSNKAGTKDREGAVNALRGSSAIAGKIDRGLYVFSDPERRTSATIIPGKERGVNLPIIGAEFFFQHVPNTLDTLETFRFYRVRVANDDPDAVLKAAIEEALCSAGGPLSQRKIEKAVKDAGAGSEKTTRRVLELMTSAGELAIMETSTSKLYALPGVSTAL